MFWFSAFVLLYVVKMTETSMQTKGRMTENVLGFGVCLILLCMELCMKVEHCFQLQKGN